MRNIILASLIVFAVTLPAIADDQNSVFPSIQSQNLNKDVVNLPADFSGDVNLVIFAFKRNHQALVDTWLGDLKLEFLDQRLRATHRRADLQKLAVGGFSAGRLRISARCLSSKGST